MWLLGRVRPAELSLGRDDRRKGVRSAGAAGPSSLALLRPGVLLALRFLALSLHARLLVVLASASLREDAALLDLLVEAAKGAFERLVLTHSDFCQSRDHLPRPGIKRFAPRVGRCSRGGPASVRAHSAEGWRSLAEARKSVNRPGCPAGSRSAACDGRDDVDRRALGDGCRQDRRLAIDEHVDVLPDGRSRLQEAVGDARPRRGRPGRMAASERGRMTCATGRLSRRP
jgi:hypothetical protein